MGSVPPMYQTYPLEHLIPKSGTAEEVAEHLFNHPDVVAAIQSGIDRHDPQAGSKSGAWSFEKSIAAALASLGSSEKS